MRKQSVIAILIFGFLSLAVSRPAYAQGNKPTTPTGLTKEDVANELTAATKQLRDVADHLPANIQASAKQFDKWKAEAEKIKKLREDAKKEADDAKDLAEQALAAAKNCDKAKYNELKGKATAHLNNEKSMTKSADGREKALNDQIDKLSNQMKDAEKAAAKAEADANNVKGGTEMAPMGGFNGAKQAYDKAVEDNAANLSHLRVANMGLKDITKDAKSDNDPAKSVKAANDALKEGADFLADPKNCPPPHSMVVPKGPTEVFVAIDTRCGTNVDLCNLKGQDPRPVADGLGMQDCGAIAATTNDAVYHCPGDASRADTISARAKRDGICVGFAEENYCLIMTPLTPERGKYAKPQPLVIQLEGDRR